MANSLLDFVMSLVRDPAAAAAYAENPTQAIADANLTDVTTADVASLIPVVSESFSTSGADAAVIDDAASNVWASGAATAAFDAFNDHVPAEAFDDASQVIEQPLGQSVDGSLHDLTADIPVDTPAQFDGVIDDAQVDEIVSATDDAEAWAQPLQDAQQLDGDTGFDVF
ncbi:Rv0340 family IniB-related protein [Mycobacterium hubeiense]|uniref:Rv0340 family IniB-related protein n=1 Tax=Mycobacterium hubeiense TaxID=1867256 RepID=UPI000C7EBFD9|nr:IniB N-terminal domain-containing protein [Mycobacterium sp. QGD 101]